jgi:hypothetical protein
MSIGLEPTQAEAEVTQTEADTVGFTGTVDIDQPVWMTSELTLNCVVNTGWPGTLDPNGTDVTGPATIVFTTSVEVPAATSSLLTGNVIISGSLKAPGLSPVMASASAIVTVDQYYSLRIDSSEPMNDLERGTSGQTEINLYNHGNGQDTFKLSLSTAPAGIRLSLESDQVTVQQDEYVHVVLEITVGNDADGGQHSIVVTAASLESGGEYKEEYTVYVVVRTFGDDLGAPGFPLGMALIAILVVASRARQRAR